MGPKNPLFGGASLLAVSQASSSLHVANKGLRNKTKNVFYQKSLIIVTSIMYLALARDK